MKNPHCSLTHGKDGDGKFIDHWTCTYCKQEGTFDQMNEREASDEGIEFKECTHVYPPCTYCEQTPICAPDCSGVAQALGAEGVYVAGMKAPPIGIMPEWLFEEKCRAEEVPFLEAMTLRIDALHNVLARYDKAGVVPEPAWLEELSSRQANVVMGNDTKH